MLNICNDDNDNTLNYILKYQYNNDENKYYIITNFINDLIDIINIINDNEYTYENLLDQRQKDIIYFSNCLFNIINKYKFVSGDIYTNEFKTKINSEEIINDKLKNIIINIYKLIKIN